MTLKGIARLLRQPIVVPSVSPESSGARAYGAAPDGTSGSKGKDESSNGHDAAVPELVRYPDYPTVTREDGDTSDLDARETEHGEPTAPPDEEAP